MILFYPGTEAQHFKTLFTIINTSPRVSVNRVSIGSDNGLSPIRRQAII